MTTYLLEAYNTDSRYRDDIRYREYTTSARRADAFAKIPKIQFTDSGHGIVFRAVALEHQTRRLPRCHTLDDYVREHLHVEKPKRRTYDNGYQAGWASGARSLASHIAAGGGIEEFFREHEIAP